MQIMHDRYLCMIVPDPLLLLLRDDCIAASWGSPGRLLDDVIQNYHIWTAGKIKLKKKDEFESRLCILNQPTLWYKKKQRKPG